MIQKDKKISRDFMCSILDALLVYIHTMINEKTYVFASTNLPLQVSFVLDCSE